MYVGSKIPAETTSDSPMCHLFTPDKALLTSVSLAGSGSDMAQGNSTAEAAAGMVANEPMGRETSFYPPDFLTELQSAIKEAAKRKSPGGLLLLSFSNLAMVISTYGHDSSERAVHDIMAIATDFLAGRGTVHRLHRDQFGVILRECDREAMDTLASQIGEAVKDYGSSVSSGPLHVICTMGSVLFPNDAGTPQSAIDHAYIALHNAMGTLHQAFESIHKEIDIGRQQMGLANYLNKAIQEKRLRLAYQPIIESKSGHIAHYEALLRIVGKDGKLSSAGPLIPVAEEMGMIDTIDLIVLNMVVAELENASDVVIAFNVSNLTTNNASWLEHCRNLLRNKPDIAARLIVEITETAAQNDLRHMAYFVACLQELGCQVALDDFGSGYTSFRQLKALSVDMVKIDGTFIRDLADNADNRFFVKTLLDFANGFGLRAVAEYVENGETAKMLMELGVEYMQGYYFAKPQNFRGWLEEGEYSPS